MMEMKNIRNRSHFNKGETVLYRDLVEHGQIAHAISAVVRENSDDFVFSDRRESVLGENKASRQLQYNP